MHARSPHSPCSALELLVTLCIQTLDPTASRVVDTCAMVDSGASCCFVNLHFVAGLDLPTVQKRRPMRLRTIDNSEICSGLITEEVHLRVVLEEHVETVVFDVADIGDDNLILGVNWLRRHNPSIDWERSTVQFNSPFCRATCLGVEPRVGPDLIPEVPTVRAFAQKSVHVPAAGVRLTPGVREERFHKLKLART